jgi:hypothetical protein
MTLIQRADTRRELLLAGTLALCVVLFGPTFGFAAETDKNAFLYVIPREILFFSAQAGQWASVRLDPGERIFHRGADGNVAAVVTSKRAIGFSAALNALHEIGLPEEETLEAFKVEGNAATVLTRRRAIGFSAQMGKWTAIERFQLGP